VLALVLKMQIHFADVTGSASYDAGRDILLSEYESVRNMLVNTVIKFEGFLHMMKVVLRNQALFLRGKCAI
jgi:hypothetical protein